MPDKGMVLLVHGSRDPQWMGPFLTMRDRVAEKAPQTQVELACLQFCGPTLEETVELLAKKGVEHITVVPVFISSQGHVLKDAPREVEAAQNRFPEIRLQVSDAVGEFAAVREAMIKAVASLAD